MPPPLLSVLPREARILFLANGQPGTDAALREELAEGVDWLRLVQLADRERASGALAARLRALGAPMPADAVEHLRRVARVEQFNMLHLEQRLAESTAALSGAGIRCVLLKGAALATTAYRSFLDRPMVDLDILVEAESAGAAVEALVAAGWRWQDRKPRDGDFSHLHHLPALLDGHQLHLSVELHTALFPPGDPFELPPRAVLDAAVPAPGQPPGVLVPSPEHQLLHVCTDLAWSHLMRQHAWRAFRDVRAILSTGAVDWDAFVATATRARAATCCYWTLRLARDLGDVELPAGRLEALRPPLPEVVLGAVARHFALVLLPTGVGCPSIRLRRLLWSTGILPRWSGHGRARPWALLALDPATAAQRSAAVTPSAARASRHWGAYWRSVLFGSPQSLA